MYVRVMVVLRRIGCKSLVPNHWRGLGHTAETPSESVEASKKTTAPSGCGRTRDAWRFRRREGAWEMRRTGISDCRDRRIWTVFTVLPRQIGNDNAIRGSPTLSLLALMHASQKSRKGVINCLIYGPCERGGVSFSYGTPIVAACSDHEIPLEVSLPAHRNVYGGEWCCDLYNCRPL